MVRRTAIHLVFVIAAIASAVRADEPLYRYEGDVLPYAPGAGWVINRACEGGCSESLQDGHFVVTYVDQNVVGAFLYNYHHRIARIDEPQPLTLWVEWAFRSEHPLPGFAYTCDGSIAVQYAQWFDVAYLFGDAVVSRSGDEVVHGLDMSEFHTYRFESVDGIHYRMSVDGFVFFASYDDQAVSSAFIQFGGDGGCGPGYFPTVNEWDFVRYGMISFGEQIVSSEPPAGFIDARENPTLDRFTVTFDQPNYVYVDEITVEVILILADSESRSRDDDQSPERERRVNRSARPPADLTVPSVIATRRLDNGPPESVEIVLDGPIPYNATTRFIFNDGALVQFIEYTYATGDTNGDGEADLADFAALQNCFGNSPVAGVCRSLDVNTDSAIDLHDFAQWHDLIIIP